MPATRTTPLSYPVAASAANDGGTGIRVALPVSAALASVGAWPRSSSPPRPPTASTTPSTPSAAAATARSCQCQWWMITNAEFQRVSPRRAARTAARRGRERGAAARAHRLRRRRGGRLGASRTAHRPGAHRPHARTSRRTPPSPSTTRDVWAVSCFVVRREHRGDGLDRDACSPRPSTSPASTAPDWSRRTRSTRRPARSPSNELYHGILSVFEAAGFREVARPKPDRAIVALELRRAADAQIVRTGCAREPALRGIRLEHDDDRDQQQRRDDVLPRRQQPARRDQDRRRSTTAADAHRDSVGCSRIAHALSTNSAIGSGEGEPRDLVRRSRCAR